MDFALLGDGANVDVQLPMLSPSLPYKEIENISPANYNGTVDSVQCLVCTNIIYITIIYLLLTNLTPCFW